MYEDEKEGIHLQYENILESGRPYYVHELPERVLWTFVEPHVRRIVVSPRAPKKTIVLILDTIV